MSEQIPSIGRIVLYRLSAQDAEQIMRRRTTGKHIAERIANGTQGAQWPLGAQAHIGNPASAGDVVPLVIVHVWPNEFGSGIYGVNGQALLDGNDVLWVTSAKEGTELGAVGLAGACMNPHEVFSQITSAAIVIYGLQSLKRAAWFPWITQQSTNLNRVLSAFGALLTSIGIGLAFDHPQAPTDVAGTYVITITGLTWTTVAVGLWHWINQFAGQQLLYDGVVSKTSPQTPQAVTTVPQPAAVRAELQAAKEAARP